ncbi:MAG TPA: hypothetical protein VNN10_08740 [Dehalococcoidia bacterium]|nr:hypothetical protein [Dehalococcoidia bacterium]
MVDRPADVSVSARITRLIDLARNEEASKLLGVEGLLEDQLDITFLDDPLDWVAYDIAQAIKAADAEEDEEGAGPTLATLVAELRLYRLLRGEIDGIALGRLVQGYLEED